jgi:membrane protease subunit HflC
MNKKVSVIVAIVFISFIVLRSSLYRIYEGRQAIITRFGKPVDTVKAAGLHIKTPFIEEVRMLDLRILNWDGYPNQIPTKDKKYIIIDTTARWQIADPLLFIQTLQNENIARKRLDGILDGITRDVISNYNLVEAVRNSNTILEKARALKKKSVQASNKKHGIIVKDKDKVVEADAAVYGEVEKITIGREKLSELIIEKGKEELKELGIDLIDVQIKRIMYEQSVQEKVFDRMISERRRVAEEIRSIGNGEKARIEGKVDLDLKKIQSEAYKRTQKIKGKADARATKIFAQAFNQNPQFYEFTKKLEVYKKVLNGKTELILSTDSDLWSTLKTGK